MCKHQKHSSGNHKCHKKAKKDCKSCRVITQKDFNKCGCEGDDKTFRIYKSGKYCLGEHIKYCPSEKNQHAIVIKEGTNDVILDLCGYTLEQKNAITSIIGIKVETNNQNITILGSYGAIKNFSQLGISVQGGTQDITIGDSTQLDINGCGGGTLRAWVDETVIQYQGGMQIGETEYLAVQGWPQVMGSVEGLILRNVNVERNTLGGWFGHGSNYDFKGCSFSYGLETRVSDAPFAGRELTPGTYSLSFALVHFSSPLFPDDDVENWKIYDCKFNNNEVISTDNSLLFVSMDVVLVNASSKNLYIGNCQVNNNKASGGMGLINYLRACVLGSGKCTVVENSEFCGNQAGLSCEGFHQSGSLDGPLDPKDDVFNPVISLTLRNCVASGNTVNTELVQDVLSGFMVSTGFTLVFNTGTTMIDCVAENNKIVAQEQFKNNTGEASGLFILGFDTTRFADVSATNIDIRGFHADRNTTNTNFGSSIGIEISADSQNISIDNAVITQHTLFEENQRLEAGITTRFGFRRLVEVVTDVGTFEGILAEYSTADATVVSALGGNADPINACSPLVNDLTNKIGVCRRGACNFTNKTTNVENAGAVATVVVSSNNTLFTMSGPPTGNGPSVLIGLDDGNVLIDAIENNPNINITLNIQPQFIPSLVSVKNSLISNNGEIGVVIELCPKVNIQGCEISEHSFTGIYLDESPCSTILQNTLLHNGIGVIDFDSFSATGSTSLVSQNKAFNNGTGYVVEYGFGPLPVRTGFLAAGGGFPQDAQICDNVEITKEGPQEIIAANKYSRVKSYNNLPKREDLYNIVKDRADNKLTDEQIKNFVNYYIKNQKKKRSI